MTGSTAAGCRQACWELTSWPAGRRQEEWETGPGLWKLQSPLQQNRTSWSFLNSLPTRSHTFKRVSLRGHPHSNHYVYARTQLSNWNTESKLSINTSLPSHGRKVLPWAAIFFPWLDGPTLNCEPKHTLPLIVAFVRCYAAVRGQVTNTPAEVRLFCSCSVHWQECQTLPKQSPPSHGLTVFTETFKISHKDKNQEISKTRFLSWGDLLLSCVSHFLNLELNKTGFGEVILVECGCL